MEQAPKNVPLSIRMSETLYGNASEVARVSGKPLSEIVRIAVSDYVTEIENDPRMTERMDFANQIVQLERQIGQLIREDESTSS